MIIGPEPQQDDPFGKITRSLLGFAHVTYSMSISSSDEWVPVGTKVSMPFAASRGYIDTVRNHSSNPKSGQCPLPIGLGLQPGSSTMVEKLPRIECQVKAWSSFSIGQPPTRPM